MPARSILADAIALAVLAAGFLAVWIALPA